MIGLTHVCRAWRGVFVSRSSLWTNLDCEDNEKTSVYLERSQSSPIHLSLRRTKGVFPYDPFFQIAPCTIRRLKSLSVKGTPDGIRAVTAHLSHTAPLLEHLSIYGGYGGWLNPTPELPSTLLDGDLSPLRTLRLDTVHTELPWRNMINLISLTLTHTFPGEYSVGQLLDFFSSTPRLSEINLRHATPEAGVQPGRLVSLTCLKSMDIYGCHPSSLLLDHLLIPAGAELTTQVPLLDSLIGEHLPRSLDNLENLANSTGIQLYLGEDYPRIKFSGPNGEVTTILETSRIDWTCLVLECLTELDISGTEWLEINHGDPPHRAHIYQALLPMKDLRTLMLSECLSPHMFTHTLHPDMSSLEVVVCPKLEELVFVLGSNRVTFDITSVVRMAAARALRGAKLGTVRVVDGDGRAGLDVSELRKHVSYVEYRPRLVQCETEQ